MPLVTSEDGQLTADAIPRVSSPAVRLMAFVIGLILALGACEALMRAADPVFHAASHRTLTKLAQLGKHGPIEVLFIGTSRTNDGVSPRLFSEALEAERSELSWVHGFNLSSASSSMEIVEWLTQQVAARPGLLLVFIEVSDVQLKSVPLQWEPPQEAPTTLEGRLERIVESHSRLVANRGLLFSDNVTRLPGLLLFAPALDGSEVLVVDQLKAWMGMRGPRFPAKDLSAWKVGDGAVLTEAGSPLPGDRLDRLVAVAKAFQDHGVRVVFNVPPLAPELQVPERTSSMHEFLRVLGARSGAEVWDWSGATLPDDIFRGTTHLNPAGRAQFSRVLARKTVERGLLDRKG